MNKADRSSEFFVRLIRETNRSFTTLLNGTIDIVAFSSYSSFDRVKYVNTFTLPFLNAQCPAWTPDIQYDNATIHYVYPPRVGLLY